jgi:hypothetical protein
MMIDFNSYLGQYIVLATKYAKNPKDISDIRIQDSKIFKVADRWVIARKLIEEDLKDEDFYLWLNSMWDKERNLKLFILNRKEVKNAKSRALQTGDRTRITN